ncbi:MAG: tetratricopeptide repeat protein, partial [Deltaproteobacteria bacterium]|nr:tetratricopeptide repeat protein [Deltaproteobacteria bacterium]
LEHNPKSKSAAMNLARALNFDKEVEQAIAVMESAHKQFPDDMAIVVKLAESYYAIRKLDRAEELIGLALEADPNNKNALHVHDQVKSRQAYNFWVPIIAIIAFPILFLAIRWMRKGRLPKVKDA